MLQGMLRYKSYLSATGQQNSRFVQMLSTFLGADECFLDEWPCEEQQPEFDPEWNRFKQQNGWLIGNEVADEGELYQYYLQSSGKSPEPQIKDVRGELVA